MDSLVFNDKRGIINFKVNQKYEDLTDENLQDIKGGKTDFRENSIKGPQACYKVKSRLDDLDKEAL